MKKTTFCGLRPILLHKVLLASFFTTSLTCLFSLNSQIEVPRISKILLVNYYALACCARRTEPRWAHTIHSGPVFHPPPSHSSHPVGNGGGKIWGKRPGQRAPTNPFATAAGENNGAPNASRQAMAIPAFPT